MKDERDNGAYRATPAADPPAPPAVDGAFWAKISSSTPLGGGRWSYAFDEIEKTAAAYGGWATLSAGRSGTAYNAAEDVGGLAAAIADNTPVVVHEVVVSGGSVPEYWFAAAVPAGSRGVTGTVDMWAGDYDAVPSGALFCNGASLSTTTYAALFAVVGYKYGGAGANFNIPDTRNKTWRGANAGEARDNATARGYALHGGAGGGAANNHDTHSAHDSTGLFTQGAGAAFYAFITDPDTNQAHGAHSETDNWPPHWIGPGIIWT